MQAGRMHGAAAALLVVGAAAAATTSSSCAQSDLNPDTVRELVEDLGSPNSADRESGVASLTGLTIYIEYHAPLLAAGVLPKAIALVKDHERNSPKLRSLALGCCADLMKAPQARQAAAGDPDFLTLVVATLTVDGASGLGGEGDDVSRAAAAQLLAELAGDEALQGALAKQGAVQALATMGPALAEESSALGKTYSSIEEVPANMNERNLVHEERYIAAALFALSSGGTGRKALLQADGGKPLKALQLWGTSYDPVLRRYGIGGLARFTAAGGDAFAAVEAAGGLPALVAGLNCGDPQAQCYAAGAVSKVAVLGGSAAARLAQEPVADALLRMLQQPAPRVSEGVERGVHRCALRALHACGREPALRGALAAAGADKALKDMLASGRLASSTELQALAEGALQGLASK